MYTCKENREERIGEERDGGQLASPNCGEVGQVLEVDWKSPCSMEVDDDDQCVDARRRDGGFQTAALLRGRPTHPRCRTDGPPSLMLPAVPLRRRLLPLGTIVEATETSTTNASSDEPEAEMDAVVAPEPEILPTANTCEPSSE